MNRLKGQIYVTKGQISNEKEERSKDMTYKVKYLKKR